MLFFESIAIELFITVVGSGGSKQNADLWIDWHGSVLLGCLECDDMRCTSWTARIAVLF